MKKISDLIRAQLRWDYVRYIIGGGANTGFSFCLFTALVYLGVNYLLANSITSILSAFFAYNMHTRFVFRQKYEYRTFFIFIISTVFAYLLSTALLYLLVQTAHLSPVVANIIAVPAVIISNYFLLKFVVFSLPRETASLVEK